MRTSDICSAPIPSWRMTLLLDFEIQTDHLFSARRPVLVIVNKTKKKEKENQRRVDIFVPANNITFFKSEKSDKYLDLIRELKTTMVHKGDGCATCGWCSRNNLQRIGMLTERL